MSNHTTPRRLLALCAVGALALAGCSTVDDEEENLGDPGNNAQEDTAEDEGDEEEDTADEGDDTDEPTDDDSDTTADAGGEASYPDDIAFDEGVTEEPCPDAVNEDNGCIYLGVLSDLTEGPFAALAVPITEAQENYWAQVNEAGGIAGQFDVDVTTYQRDTKYQAAEHASQYQQIEPDILALAQSLGTVNTEGVLDQMDANDVVAIPASWWSGYNFTDNDHGLIVEAGYSYCVEAAVGLDWYGENHSEVGSVAAVGYPGDYGGDSAAGVETWAEINGVSEVTVVSTAPNQVVGDQGAAIEQLAGANPDVIVMAVGPAEAAEIAGSLAGLGYEGRFLGSLPTWNPALLDSPAGPVLEAQYNHMIPSQGWDGDAEGAEAMREAYDGDVPDNHGYIFGWLISYPMHDLLDAAAQNGDLTRAGLRDAVNGLEVDFGGMAQAVTYGGEGKDVAAYQLRAGTPSADAPMGMDTPNETYEGSTFDEMEYTSACSAVS